MFSKIFLSINNSKSSNIQGKRYYKHLALPLEEIAINDRQRYSNNDFIGASSIKSDIL